MLGGKYHGRRKGIAIREGSVRQARAEAKLSLAQVAANQVSRTAVHHIENGRVKPSIETLRLIARQTGKPIEYFLLTPNGHPELTERPAELLELQRLISVRNFNAAVKLGLALLDQRWTDDDSALVHFYLGQAYCRLVEPQEALLYLPAARAQFERQADEWLAVETLDWEASAWGLLEDPKAIPLANQALERSRKLGPAANQIEARILGHLASMFVVTHSWALAISHYEAAVEVASAVKDLLQLAKMHHGLGLAYVRLRRPGEARQHLDKALALYSMESDQSAIYRVENDLGHLLLQEGQVDSAEQHLLKALDGADELQMGRRGRGFILVNLGNVNLQNGRLEDARRYLNEAIEAGEAFGERIVLADANALLGRLEERLGDIPAADARFDEALHLLSEIEMPDRERDCHMEYAQVLEDRGDVARSAKHWKLAAEIGKSASLGISFDRRDAEPRVTSERGRSVS